MKKKYLIVFAVIIAMFTAYGAYKTQTDVDVSDMLLFNMEALADNEETTGYKKTTGDCRIEATAGVIIELKMAALKIAAGEVGADGSITFKDVKVDCELNGTFLCKPKDCGDFLTEILR